MRSPVHQPPLGYLGSGSSITCQASAAWTSATGCNGFSTISARTAQRYYYTSSVSHFAYTFLTTGSHNNYWKTLCCKNYYLSFKIMK
jgi:hypothetical protein